MTEPSVDYATFQAARLVVEHCGEVREADVERAKQRMADGDVPDDEELAMVMICRSRLEGSDQ